MTSTHVDVGCIDVTGREHLLHALTDAERTVLWLRRHADEASPPSRRWTAMAAAATLAILIGGSTVALAQIPGAGSPAVGAFTDATREYALLHRRLESTLPRLDVTSNPETIQRAVEQLRAALRAARPDASPGDFFTEALAADLRLRIDDALFANGFSPADVRATEAADGIDAAMAPLKVNGRFPWMYASAMFPCVLKALPALPAELQYRIVGNTLVLVDVHADAIVDVLPYALASTER